jgi:hypothetical protein
MEGVGKGAVAFSKTGDPQLGEWADAIILRRYGDVPDDLPPYAAGSTGTPRDQRAIARIARCRRLSDRG